MQNKTAVQQIVERFNNKIQTLKKLRDENKDDKDVVFLCRSRISGFQEAASIAAEFLEQEKKEDNKSYCLKVSNPDIFTSNNGFGEG